MTAKASPEQGLNRGSEGPAAKGPHDPGRRGRDSDREKSRERERRERGAEREREREREKQ